MTTSMQQLSPRRRSAQLPRYCAAFCVSKGVHHARGHLEVSGMVNPSFYSGGPQEKEDRKAHVKEMEHSRNEPAFTAVRYQRNPM